MPETLAGIEEVKELIQDAFPSADVSGIEEDGHRITGVIRWNDFAGMDLKKRNEEIRTRVRNKLGVRGLNVGFLLPVAPGDKL